jgi:ligand-binding sensor domain-containing protein/signal transduction histidine kinase
LSLRSSSTFRSLRPLAAARRPFAGLFAGAVIVCLLETAYAADPDRALSQYLRDRWGAEQGLPAGMVSAIAQTPDGYLWIGTEKGLVRFDGLSFRLVQPSSTAGFSITHVLGLTVDTQGTLWIRQQGPSLQRYRDGKFDDALAGLPPEAGITAMSRGKNGRVVVSALVQGILRNDGAGWQTLIERSLVSRSPVIALTDAPDGTVWMGTRDTGVFYLREGRVVPVAKGLPDSKINCLLAIGKDDVLIGTDNGVVRWNGVEATASGVPAPLAHVQALAMLEDRDANVWIGTSTGLLRLNAKGVTSLDEGDRRSSSGAVSTLFEDREGNIWMGTTRGLERLRDGVFMTYSAAEGLPSESSGPVFVDAANRTWFAPAEGGLYWLKGTHIERVTQAGLAGDVIYSIDGDPAGGKGDIWIGRQRGGLTRLRDLGGSFAAETYTEANGLAQNSVYAVHENRDGTLWAGTLSGGVSRFKDGRFTTYTTANGLASNTVTSIVEGSDSTMWFGTPAGVSELSNGKWRAYMTLDGLPSDDVNCLFEDAGGLLWIGTADGLGVLGAEHADRVERPAGAAAWPREPILGLAQDSGGSLWIATANRVLRATREQLLRGAGGAGDAGDTVRWFGLADGLRGLEGVKRHRSVVADSLGRIWFSMNRGLSVADAARAARSSVPALVQIQSVSADGRPLDLHGDAHGGVRIPAGRQRVTFNYAGLSLSVPERVRFRYRLDGFDREWSEPITAREAVYTNLGPGPYRFRVRASNSDGLWSESEAALGFDMDPAFWQTWWFRLSCVLAGISAIWALAQFRLHRFARQLNVRFEERLAERTRIAQELHDTLLQGFLSASMQLDVAVDRLPADSPAKPPLTRVLQLMAQVIEEGRNAVRGLRSSTGGAAGADDLEQALSRVPQELALQEQPAGFRVIVEGRARPLHPVIRDEVYRIGREALVNAFRHAGASSIEVELDYAASSLRMLVRDNGCGIDPQVLRAGRDGHWGLSGMRERAERIGARFKVFSRAAAGTEVELSVPGHTAFQTISERRK